MHTYRVTSESGRPLDLPAPSKFIAAQAYAVLHLLSGELVHVKPVFSGNVDGIPITTYRPPHESPVQHRVSDEVRAKLGD